MIALFVCLHLDGIVAMAGALSLGGSSKATAQGKTKIGCIEQQIQHLFRQAYIGGPWCNSCRSLYIMPVGGSTGLHSG